MWTYFSPICVLPFPVPYPGPEAAVEVPRVVVGEDGSVAALDQVRDPDVVAAAPQLDHVVRGGKVPELKGKEFCWGLGKGFNLAYIQLDPYNFDLNISTFNLFIIYCYYRVQISETLKRSAIS